MIDPTVHAWLERKDLPKEATALIVQFGPPSSEVLAAATTRAARIQAMESHVTKRLASLTKGAGIPKKGVQILGPTGTAIIQASPTVLRGLIGPDGPLAQATDVTVRPNVEMTGVA